MSVDQTVICDNPDCREPIAHDESHFEVSFHARVVDPNADDLTNEGGAYQYHPDCFTKVMRPVLGLDTAVQDRHQEVVAERQAQLERAQKMESVNEGDTTLEEAFPDQVPADEKPDPDAPKRVARKKS